MNYFFCRQNLFESNSVIEIDGHNKVTGKFLWTTGAKIEKDFGTQTLFLNTDHGTNFPAFFDTTIPVMSNELIEKLHSLGVTNFDSYSVLLKRKDTGEVYSNYKIVNFLTCIDAFDSEKSNYNPNGFEHDGPVFINEDIDKDIAAFRLKEPTDLLVVNEIVAKALKEEKYFNLLLQNTLEYDGV